MICKKRTAETEALCQFRPSNQAERVLRGEVQCQWVAVVGPCQLLGVEYPCRLGDF